MKENIVLDLDGVIADIDTSISNILLSRGVADYNYSHWLISDSNDDQAMEIFNDTLFWKNLKPYEDAWHQTNYWYGNDVDIHIVTARRCDAAMKTTHAWLDLWRISTSSVTFTNIHEKHHVIEKLNPKFVVEDNPNEVNILRSHGVNAYLRKQWYNKEFWSELPTVESLYDLDWN